jgi:hypothetical protein
MPDAAAAEEEDAGEFYADVMDHGEELEDEQIDALIRDIAEARLNPGEEADLSFEDFIAHVFAETVDEIATAGTVN